MAMLSKEQSAEGWARVRLARWWGNGTTMATIGSRTERLIGRIGTETRPRLLREAAVGDIGTMGETLMPAMPREGRRSSDCKPK